MKTKNRFSQITLLLLLAGLCPLPVAEKTALAQDEPTIAKDWVQVNAFTNSSYHKNYDIWSWVPRIKFRVNGPIASGSQLYVEFATPGTGPWVKFDCKTGAIEKDHWWDSDCGGPDVPEEKGVTYVGPVNFSIKMKNELSGTNATLFTGKAKVAKSHSNLVGPHYVNSWVYYVDHDWALPIGYVFYERDEIRGWNYPLFAFAVAVRGEAAPLLEPHLFHEGKEVGRTIWRGEEVGKPGCGSSEMEVTTTHITSPSHFWWTRWRCEFSGVRAWNKTGGKNEGMFGPMYLMNEHPGDYEVKVLSKGHLVRSFKFAVDAEGKIVDNGIAPSNKLGTDRIIVPVQVLGDVDGVWNRLAWKTEAFYGNPLTGFTPAK